MTEEKAKLVSQLTDLRSDLMFLINFLDDEGFDAYEVRQFFKKLMPERFYRKLFNDAYDKRFSKEVFKEQFLEFAKAKLDEVNKEIEKL